MMTEPFALATFSTESQPAQVGIVRGGHILPLATLAPSPEGNVAGSLSGRSMLSLVEQWDEVLAVLDRALGANSAVWREAMPIGHVRFHAPIEMPRQIFCTGANYRTHVVHLTMDMKVGPEGLEGEDLRRWAEKMMDDRVAHGEPYVFMKPSSAVAGPNDDLVLPTTTVKPDWELELAVVIGRGGYNIPRDAAMSHVAGYAIVNDVSARDLIARTDYAMLGTDWLRSKGQPGFLPFGPYLVPARFVADPYSLGIRLCVDGQLMQNESTADMMFDIARQIEYISRYSRLLPGDVICTGSPAGNGTHYNRFLKAGDLMVGEIDGLGAQRIHCIAP
jgi:2,4-diketo-3-deoxy-L-fuconate hydrolase